MLFMFAAAATALLLMDHDKAGKRGEAYLLMLASLIGMNLMGSSADLVMLYLSIETASIPLYILSGFLLDDERSTEAGFKYFLYGTLASTIMLYGFSLLFGFSGTTDLYRRINLWKDFCSACLRRCNACRCRAGLQSIHRPISFLGAGCL
jgi:NADH-quinone oxidoreductase subunit N